MEKLTCVLLLVLSMLLSSWAVRKQGSIPIGRLVHESCALLNENLPENEIRGRNNLGGISCRDETNEKVEWYINYKLPKITNSPLQLVREGRAYTYIHPAIIEDEKIWRLSSKTIDDPKSFLGRTLTQRYLPSVLWVAYNDQFKIPGMRTPHGGAHSKGILMLHVPTRTAVWIVHSVPHLPVVSRTSFYPTSGLNNGQMIMCMNIQASDLVNIVQRLTYIGPHLQSNSMVEELVRGSFLNDDDALMFANLGLTRSPSDDTAKEMRFMQIIHRSTHQRFQAYFKPPINDLDLYSEFIAPIQNSHIQVQSWSNGAGGRICEIVHNPAININHQLTCVQDVTEIRVRARDCSGHINDIVFNSKKDHSKWAVTEDSGIPWVCISDLNRMRSQKARGGSALCIASIHVWKVFNQSINALRQTGANRNVGIPREEDMYRPSDFQRVRFGLGYGDDGGDGDLEDGRYEHHGLSSHTIVRDELKF